MNREQVTESIPASIMSRVQNIMCTNASRPEAILNHIDTWGSSVTDDGVSSLKATAVLLYENAPLSLANARPVMLRLVTVALLLPEPSFKPIALAILSLQDPDNSRSMAFDVFIVRVRERLSLILENRGEFRHAAYLLTSISTETHNTLPDRGFSLTLRIAQLFIAASLVDQAENYLSRATANLSACSDDTLRLQHRISQARVLDLKCRFEDAAHRYYMLANEPQVVQLVDNMTDTHTPTLVHAVTCAILAPAGPRRSRLLALLYNDERSRRLEIFPLLESIHTGRLLHKHQIDRFLPTLQPHQLTPHPDGDTMLDRAVLEHNLLAISRMYSDIGLSQLAQLLNVSPEKAEKTARIMINEKRMIATIDQVDRLLQFHVQSSSHNIDHWDALIASLCSQVDDCVDAIIERFPQLSSQT